MPVILNSPHLTSDIESIFDLWPVSGRHKETGISWAWFCFITWDFSLGWYLLFILLSDLMVYFDVKSELDVGANFLYIQNKIILIAKKVNADSD